MEPLDVEEVFFFLISFLSFIHISDFIYYFITDNYPAQ